MNLFVFGLGYSARQYLDRFGGGFARVCGTVRSPDRAGRTHNGCELLRLAPDGADPAIAGRLAEADLLLVSVPPDADGDPVLARFAAPIAASPIRRIVYLSTVGVYRDHQGQWIDESAPLALEAGRRRRRADAEAAWRRLAPERTSILRLAGIYGPGRNALVNLRAGTARRIVKPGQVFNRIHVADVAQAIAAAFAHERTGVWNVCDDEPAPPQDVVSFAATLLGVAPPPAVDFADAELGAMARSFYATSNRVSNAAMKRDLQVALACPTYREGLTALYRDGEGR